MTDYLKEDIALTKALHDVPVPSGLESRLLASMPAQVELPLSVCREERSERAVAWSRRSWLSSAASLAGLAFVGQYLYVHRKLGNEEVTREVAIALRSDKWVVPWLAMANAPSTPLPKQLRMPRGWQYISTVWDKETAAFDLTLPGGPDSVLFAIPMARDLSGFPASSPKLPQGATAGGDWRLSMWRSGNVLYVLASKGTDRDYEALFLDAGTPALV